MKLYPVPGRLVRDPETGRELADPLGEVKPDDSAVFSNCGAAPILFSIIADIALSAA